MYELTPLNSNSKAQSEPQNKKSQQHFRVFNKSLSPLWLVPILWLFCAPLLIMHRRGVASRHQQVQMTLRSEAFFDRIGDRAKNKSATQFDRLAATLGFFPNDPLSLTAHPATSVDTEAQAQYTTIEPSLNQFLSEQLGDSTAPLPSLPSSLRQYFDTAQPKLLSLQAHLLKQSLPEWEISVSQMSDEPYPFPGFTNVLNTQKLLLLSALSHYEQKQHEEMFAALEASWRLNQAVAQRPELVSKILVSTVNDYQSRILRHTTGLSHSQLSQWHLRFSQQGNLLSVMEGVRFDVWLQYETLRKSLIAVTAQSSQLAPFSPVHRFQLANIDTTQTAHRAINFLNQTNICETAQALAEAQLIDIQTAQWNDAVAPTPAVLARRWKTEGDHALSSELTHQVLSAKQHYQEHRQWPEASRVPSTECPGEHWLYEKQDDALKIRFSAQLTPPPKHALQASLTPMETD